MYKPKIILYTKCESTSAARKVLPAHIQNQSLTAPHGKPRQHHSTASCSRFGITTPARAFSLSRRMGAAARMRGCGTAEQFAPLGKFQAIIPRSENVCLHKHFREAVNDAAARMRGQGIRPDVLPSGKTTAYIIPPLYEQIKFFMVGAPRGPRTTGNISS